MAPSIKIEYSPGTNGRTAIEDDLDALGRLEQDWKWIKRFIERLSAEDLEADFWDWNLSQVMVSPDARALEGTWGHLRIQSTYVLMLWRYTPKAAERNLGAPVEIIIDGVGLEGEILQRFRDLGKALGEVDADDEPGAAGGGG